MNEYTRREEIFWTLVSFCILVLSVVGDTVKFGFFPGKGPMVHDEGAIARQKQADVRVAEFTKARCVSAAEKLAVEVGILNDSWAKAEERAAASRDAQVAAAKASRSSNKRTDAIKVVPPTKQAQNVLKYASSLLTAGCRKLTNEAAVDETVAPAWKAVEDSAKLRQGGSEPEQQATARQLRTQFPNKAPAEQLHKHTLAAQASLQSSFEKAQAAASVTKVGEPAVGLFPPKAAILIGVLLPVIALGLSYASLRSASTARGKLLVALRRFANTPEAGLQAAAIVRLAANPNGGEPGIVIGSALGGLIAALLTPADNPNLFKHDVFVAGAMGGLLLGLVGQWLARVLIGVSRWRERTQELGDVEKPTIPVALILGGVSPGLEQQFLRYFEALPIGDAAIWVQKLAAQAEEQILAAADAAAQAHYAQGSGGTAWS